MSRAVLFDFSGTLFWIESAHDAVVAALGPGSASWAPALQRAGAINGSGTPADLPDDLREVWEARDLSPAAHRAAYAGLGERAGLTREQAAALYDRGLDPAAWTAFDETLPVLRDLRAGGVPVALVSNVGWDPRPVLERWHTRDLFDTLVLSDEVGAIKPDPAIFRLACERLGVDPGPEVVMVGDNADADAGAAALGIRFALVAPSEADRPPGALHAAVRP